jgi:hypothetical protein
MGTSGRNVTMKTVSKERDRHPHQEAVITVYSQQPAHAALAD